MMSESGPTQRIGMTYEQAEVLSDALMAADEVLTILHLRGTEGLHQESGAGRIADVFRKVHDAKSLLFSVVNPPEDLGRRLT